MTYRTRSAQARLFWLIIGAVTPFAVNAQMFGRHSPHGQAAVTYIYGSNGTWKSVTRNGANELQPLQYNWSWYGPNCGEALCPDYHPPGVCVFTPLTQSRSNVNTFTQFGTVQNNHTAPDANCLILFDADNDGSILDETIVGSAFMEHRGRGQNGNVAYLPRYQFWFDDNWLARYMSEAYGKPHPIGLHDAPANPGAPRHIRWRAVGGDNSNWTPYGSDSFIDQLALDGIYFANAWDFPNAKAKWDRILELSGPNGQPVYDWSDQRYEYTFPISDVYYYGLWAILSERLLAQWPSFSGRNAVLQHAMSLRSNILTMQERTDGQLGARLGWRTTCDAPTLPGCVSDPDPSDGVDPNESVINIETTAAMVLGLGAEAWRVYEPGFGPLSWCTTCSYFNRPHHAFSAVVGLSSPGYMVDGPNATLPAGYYTVDFQVRMGSSPGAQLPAVYLAIVHGGSVLDYRVLYTSDMPPNNEWVRTRLVFYTAGDAGTSFQVYWYGSHDIDVGSTRVRAL